MASVNKVIVMGNLGKDPEVKNMPSGGAVCNLSVATTRTWKSKDGERQEETEWHRVVVYDRQAEVAGQYLAKGRPVYIEGRLKTRKWQDKEGRDVYTTEIICETMQLMGGAGQGQGGGQGAQGGHDDYEEAPRQSRQAQQPAQQPAQNRRPSDDGYDDAPRQSQQRPMQNNQQRPAQNAAPNRQQTRQPERVSNFGDDDIPF